MKALARLREALAGAWRRNGTMPPPAADMLGAATLPHDAVTIPRAAPIVTAELLFALGWVQGRAYAEALERPLRTYGIQGRVRLAAFLAQVGHESGGGRWRSELWGGTPAQLRYEGRTDLGNTRPGDGYRFRGRGLIQVTGRTNAMEARDALRPGMSVEEFLAWLEGVEGASVSACWWWATRGCNDLADRGDFERLTRRINGGVNGLADRTARWEKAKAALSESG